MIAEEVIGEVIVPPNKKLEDLIRLSELCVDLLRQNEEFYAEVRKHVKRQQQQRQITAFIDPHKKGRET